MPPWRDPLPAVANGIAYVASYGLALSEQLFDGVVEVQPTIAEAILYATTETGDVYAFGLPG